MSDNTDNIGPDFLESLAARQEAQGFDVEANLLRQNAQQWSRDRQGIAADVRCVKPAAAQRAGVVTAELVDLSLEHKRVTFAFTSESLNPFPNLGATRYHLLPQVH